MKILSEPDSRNSRNSPQPGSREREEPVVRRALGQALLAGGLAYDPTRRPPTCPGRWSAKVPPPPEQPDRPPDAEPLLPLLDKIANGR